jgi:phosphatidylserine/phosphatidylglycerophosphate/cardiolipin synthase-like enzyme
LHVISLAEIYVYFEDQYLVGNDELDYEIRKAMDGSYLKLIAVTTGKPGLPQLENRRTLFWKPLMDRYGSRVKVYERLGTDLKPDGPNSYLHAKLTIVDDAAFCVGSVNFSRRSWYHDSESLITVTNGAQPSDANAAPLARALRISRWNEHLGGSRGAAPDPRQALGEWNAVSGAARVRPWRPGPIPKMNWADNLAWNTVLDPPERRP